MKEQFMIPAGPRRFASVGAGLAALGMLVAGCGGSSPASQVTSQSAQSFDVVSGSVLAATATGASVQSASGPASIAYSSITRFTKTSTTQRSSLAKGDCVTVMPVRPSNAGAQATTSGATAEPARTVTAAVVTVTSTSGCQRPNGTQFQGGPSRGFGFGSGGSGEGGAPGPNRTGFPQPGGFPSGGPGTARRGFFGGAFGTISSITGSTVALTTVFAQGGTTTVKTTSATVYDETVTATRTQVVAGECVNAFGTTDVSGVLDARSVSITKPVNGACRSVSSPFGGGRFFERSNTGSPPGAGGA